MPISGMTQGSGKSRFAGRLFACACAALCAAAVGAPGAGAQAVDEYTLTLPQASGDQHLPPGAGAAPGPVGSATGTGDESSTNLEAPTGDEGGLAKKVARDTRLGAPPKYVKRTTPLGTAGRGVPEIVADTVDEREGGAPALLAVIGAVAAAGVWLAFRRRRANLTTTG
jgi:hypothetical protein